MGYKRCLEVNELEDLSLNKPKRFESNNELVSLDDIVTPNKAFAKTVITGKCFCFNFFSYLLNIL